jgi:hypothetical protein
MVRSGVGRSGRVDSDFTDNISSGRKTKHREVVVGVSEVFIICSFGHGYVRERGRII